MTSETYSRCLIRKQCYFHLENNAEPCKYDITPQGMVTLIFHPANIHSISRSARPTDSAFPVHLCSTTAEIE